jgi:hypothetical protein
LEAVAKSMKQVAVCSREMAAFFPADTIQSLGSFVLQGIPNEQTIFSLALLWHSHDRPEGEVGPADWTSQTHGVRHVIKQQAPDRGQRWLRRWPAGFSFFPLWQPASADAAGTSMR